MNDKTAHNKLKKLQESVNGYKNSRRSKCEGNKLFAETMKDIDDNRAKVKLNK